MDVPQFSTDMALQVLDDLRNTFGSGEFQASLRRLQDELPQRRTRGHQHVRAFAVAFEQLALAGYRHVLPRWGLRGDWDGLRDLDVLLEAALGAGAAREGHAEINVLLGLPRDASLRGPKKEDELLVYRPEGDGGVQDYPCSLSTDMDGDKAQEFWIEDVASGELLRH